MPLHNCCAILVQLGTETSDMEPVTYTPTYRRSTGSLFTNCYAQLYQVYLHTITSYKQTKKYSIMTTLKLKQ